MTEPNDDELVAAARGGDRDAFGVLLRRHDGRLRALAHGLLGSQAAMDDALQDAYLKAYRSLDGFRGEAAIGTWLHRITYTTCIDHLRRAGRLAVEPLDQVPEASLGEGDADLGRLHDRLPLADALACLPDGQRAVVLAVDLAGLPYDEVAAALGVAEGTVASRLHRARATLRAALDAPAPRSGGDR